MTVNTGETFDPKSQTDWRDWLTKNHSAKKEIWLIIYKKATGKQILSYQNALDEALCFGWIDGVEKGIDSEKFALRFTPRLNKSRWSEKNEKRYKELLKSGWVAELGKKAFANKGFTYTSFSNKKGAIEWHLLHKMPKNPTLDERIEWHKEHQNYCACRPIPKNLEVYFSK